MANLFEVYNILKENYGQQGWWPVTEKGETIPSYKLRRLLTEKQILEVCIGAFLASNTSWDPNVVSSIINLNKENLINLEKLKKIDEKQLAKLIQSSGYYNQKASNIKLFVKFLHEKPISKLIKLETLQLREILLALKGVGPETADSMLLYGFYKPSFVIDAYTKRIFSRLGFFNSEIEYSDIQEMFHYGLSKDVQLFNEFHALIVEHAKRHCKKEPDCLGCCLREECEYTKRF